MFQIGSYSVNKWIYVMKLSDNDIKKFRNVDVKFGAVSRIFGVYFKFIFFFLFFWSRRIKESVDILLVII